MALSDKLTKPPVTVHGSPCSIGLLLDTLPADEVVAFRQMLGSPTWNATMIYDAVRDEGHTIGRQSVNRHRAGRCRCFKDAA